MEEFKLAGNFLYFTELFKDTLGTNYRVAEVQNRRPLAHKLLCVVNPALTANPESLKRIKILLEGIKKSNIPFLYSPEKILEEKGQVRLVYEYHQAKTLDQVLSDAEKSGLTTNFDLAFSLALAVADIIEVGSSIVISGEKSFHGFLTPDNILIHADGKIFLKNYGLFPYLERSERVHSEFELQYGALLSPEVLRKEKIVQQTDVYYLGYLIFRMLTGKYFSYSPGEDFDAKFANLTFKQYIPSTEKDFLTRIITFFKKTLHPDPLKRFLSVRDFKEFITNYFHIEELSSITFNLAYFMNTLYGDQVETDEKILHNEMAYVVPEPKPEPAKPAGKDLVGGILEGLDEREKSKRGIWIAAALVGVAALAVALFFFFQGQRAKKLEQAQVKEREAVSARLADMEKQYQKRIEDLNKSFETKIATTAADQKAKEDERLRLLDEIKKQRQIEEDKIKAEQERLKQVEAEKQRVADETAKQAEAEKQKVAEQERLKQEAAEKQRLEDSKKTKVGDIIPLTEATVKPGKISGGSLTLNQNLRKKYTGQTFNVMTSVLIDETGKVAKLKILGDVPNDLRSLIEDSLYGWKYKPAQKDGVNVKVWMTVPLKFTF